MIRIGGADIVDIAVGSTPIEKAYIGSQLVWEKSEPDFVQVNYIENTSNAYIDTGFKPKQNTKVEVGFMLTAAGAVLGARNSSTSNMFVVLPRNSAGSAIWYYGAKSTTSSNGCSLDTYYTASNNGRVLTISNGTTITGTASTFSCSYNLVLFGMNTAGTITNFKSRIYYCNIYDNGSLVRNFVPMYQRSTGLYGMYDKVNDVFYTSPNGTDFTGASVT